MKISLMCGIGDFFSIVDSMSPEEKMQVTDVYFATRQESKLKYLCKLVFPKLENTYILCDEFTNSEELNKNPNDVDLINKFCVHSLQDLENRFPLKMPIPEGILDYNLSKIANEFIRGKRKFNRTNVLYDSYITGESLCDKFDLAKKEFIFIHPWSDNQRFEERDFTDKECQKIVDYLERNNLLGVVVNYSSQYFPIKSDNIIDLTNKTDLYEALDLLQDAKGFIGCSSSFSVYASRILDRKDIIIKASDGVRLSFNRFYYMPNTCTYFLHKDLSWL